jgi:hypothetical protein
LVIAGVALAGCGSSSSSTPSAGGASSSPATTSTPTALARPGPETTPLEPGAALAPASTAAPGTPVDGVHCAPVEQLAYHIHAHLQVYVNGQPRSLPGAIGLLGPVAQQTQAGPFYGAVQCYYWPHTHASDGVIHIESPPARVHTLADFFDEWRQPLSAHQVGGATGAVTAFINGLRWTNDPRALPLLPHAVIQLDVGSPVVPFGNVSWAGSGL